MRRPMQNNSSPRQAVFQPFLGSGTTLIAAETCGRVCFGIELNPCYVDMSVQRWQAFTGNKATLEEDGRSFQDVAKDRGAGGLAGGLKSDEHNPPARGANND